MNFRNSKQIKMISGKMYHAFGGITLLPEKYFFTQNNFELDFDKHILYINKDSKPNFFIFLNYIYDSHKTLYVKVLYKNNIYIAQNEYHIGDFIELLK